MCCDTHDDVRDMTLHGTDIKLGMPMVADVTCYVLGLESKREADDIKPGKPIHQTREANVSDMSSAGKDIKPGKPMEADVSDMSSAGMDIKPGLPIHQTWEADAGKMSCSVTDIKPGKPMSVTCHVL
ncbi:hypothetical protein DPMN_008812 [Dreissena polymorpha]|uniref:Uncharacterized protein n=1 Tax=Dreissena polymorpha TaxID=45954 RepID=A0A9D4MVU0_DREPO|nr:hypothetical protein DPMN_008812 [Dreissena polymorpha]